MKESFFQDNISLHHDIISIISFTCFFEMEFVFIINVILQ